MTAPVKLPAPTLLTVEQWRAVLKRLSAEIGGAPCEIGVVGGVAIALSHSARRTTHDLDAILDDATSRRVLDAAEQIAHEFALPPMWLNNKAQQAGFVVGQALGDVVYDDGHLVVRAASTEQLLAMKVTAWRDQVDIDDAVLLLTRLAIDDLEEVWNRIGRDVPPKARSHARENLEEAWEIWAAYDEPS